MVLDGVDRNVKYLALTFLLLLPVIGWHNASLGAEDEMSFAMNDITIECTGAEVAGFCLGIEKRNVDTVAPENAEEYRRVEAECGLDAQGLCNANPNMSGMEWTDHPNATYQGQTCSQWAEQDDRITLLSCDQTFNDITQWGGEQDS